MPCRPGWRPAFTLLLSGLPALFLTACIGEIESGSVAPADIPDPLTLARTRRPNAWLICPERTCRAEAGATAPVYPVPPAELWQTWRAVLEDSPRVSIVTADEPRLLLLAQDRTPVFRFVDTVALHVFPAADGGSTFAAYSHSEIGYSDLGTNRRRLEEWIEEVEERLNGVRISR